MQWPDALCCSHGRITRELSTNWYYALPGMIIFEVIYFLQFLWVKWHNKEQTRWFILICKVMDYWSIRQQQISCISRGWNTRHHISNNCQTDVLLSRIYLLPHPIWKSPKSRLPTVLDIQKPILILLLFINGRHEGVIGRNRIRAK